MSKFYNSFSCHSVRAKWAGVLLRAAMIFLVIAFALSALADDASMQPPLVTQYLDTKNGRLAYDDTGGDGPLAIAIPGMGDLRQEYRFLTPFLTRAGYRVATLDLRGFGGSSAQWNDYSAQAVAGDILKLESHLERKDAVLIGNSFAAGAVVWAAHEAPERAPALILLGPVLRDSSTPSPWYERAVINLMFLSPWRVHFWLQYWDSLFSTHKPSDQAAYRLALQRNLLEAHRMTALKAIMGLSKARTAGILHEVKTPTLIVMGSEDPDFDDSISEAKWASRQIGSQDRIVQGAGHYPHVEMPDQVGPAIVSFLQSQNSK